MKKKIYTVLPVRERHEKRVKSDYSAEAETVKVKGERILIVNIYQKEKQPIYRIFFNGSEYFTQNMRTGKCMTSMIDRLLNYWWYYTDTVRSRNYLHVEERYRELVLAYLHGDRTEDTYHIILNYQIKQHEEKLAEKRKRYTNPVDETMETIPELPKSFDTWVDRGPLLSARYIFYRYTKKRKAEGICSYCGAKVEIDHPHHNEQGTCPNCGSRIKYKAEGKSRTLTFTTRASLMQRTKDDRVVVRYFNIVRKFDENHTPQTGVWEMQRSFYNRDLDDLTEEPYEWGNFRNVSNRWVHLGDAKPKMFYTPNTTDDDYYAALYPYNVKALTKETVLRNFEVDKLAMHLQQGHFCLQSLIKRATKGEYFYEYMCRCT